MKKRPLNPATVKGMLRPPFQNPLSLALFLFVLVWLGRSAPAYAAPGEAVSPGSALSLTQEVLNSPAMIEVEAELDSEGYQIAQTALDRTDQDGREVLTFITRRIRSGDKPEIGDDRWSRSRPVFITVAVNDGRIEGLGELRIDPETWRLCLEYRLPDLPDTRFRAFASSQVDREVETQILGRSPDGRFDLLAGSAVGVPVFVEHRSVPVPEEIRSFWTRILCYAGCIGEFFGSVEWGTTVGLAKCILLADILTSVKKSEAEACADRYSLWHVISGSWSDLTRCLNDC